MNENTSKPAMTYDDLIKGYFGGRHHHGHGHHHRQHRGSLAKSAERLFASYYGKPPHRKRPAPAPTLAVSYSADDGEMLAHASGSAVFEEYVVQASLSESGFEEYVVERAPMAGEASSSERSPAPTAEPHEEYRVDVADLLGSDSPNRFAPRSPRAPAPAGVATPGPGSAPANSDWSAPSPVRSGEAGPSSASDDDFFADMQSILTREKVYDPVSKKTIEADKIGKNAAVDQPQAPNSQAIFDKIAQSMQYANTYDLGTVELENRFGDFDRTSDLQLKAEADKRRGRTQSMAPKPRVATAADVDSQDFIQDIDTMHRQRGPSPPPQVKDDDPFAYLPPESSGIADSANLGAGWADYRPASSAGAGAPSSSNPGFPIPNIPIPGIPTPTLPMPWAAPSAPMTASTSTDLGGAFVASALQNTLGNAADINSYFATMGAADFVSWFNQNVAGQGPWAKRAIGTGPAVATNFQAIWNNIPQMFGTPQINLLQFLSLMSILINEVGETLAPIAERVGVKDHPGIAYAFDSIENLKVSYNDGGSNWTAYRCFNDADFIAAHGSKPLGDKLSNTTDTRWSGHEYPSGYPTDVNPAVNGFILEADFYKFRGRGLIQTTWRGAYQNLIRFVQGYTGTQAEILARTSAWTGMGVDKAANVSANADWDALFMRTDLEIPCVAIAQHSSGAGNYLNLSGDVTVLNGTGQGSIWRIGKCISGGNAYADLFRRRVVAICNLLGN